MSEEAVVYDATRIEVLEWPEAVRKRPGMYVGSTGERGVHGLVFEIAERSVRDVVAGRARSVGITLMADGGVRVTDDGPGVPVEAAGHTDGPGLETLLTGSTGRTGPVDRHDPHLGLFGVGPSVTNALSSRLTAEVRRDGIRWVQEYARGRAITEPTAAGAVTGSGTTVTFWPDADIFPAVRCSSAVLTERFRELAFLNRRLDLRLTDEQSPGGSRSERFRFPGGAADFVAFLDEECSGTPLHPDVIGVEREDARMAGTVEVALRWCEGHGEEIRGFANSRPTSEGGTHVTGFRDGLTAAIDDYARGRRLLTASDPGLGADRITEGLTAVVSVKLDRPEYPGATRELLGGADVRAGVAEVVREGLGAWLEAHPEQARAVVGHVLRRGR
ncbi:DNA gyrase subunit B [Streptomyces sp. NPDC051773]|uniref:DNA gyrase subunit B n=1 Tax=Streptomyces sp. NPDC051773 TaxID=3156682 RepID=UPI0034162AB0